MPQIWSTDLPEPGNQEISAAHDAGAVPGPAVPLGAANTSAAGHAAEQESPLGVVVALDKFKGSLRAADAVDAVARGILRGSGSTAPGRFTWRPSTPV